MERSNNEENWWERNHYPELARGEEHNAQVKEEAVEGAQSLRIPQEMVVCMGGEAGEAKDPMAEIF